MPLTLTLNPISTSQSLLRGFAFGQNPLVTVGSSAYYITREQIDAVTYGGSNNLQIFKSSNGTSWTRTANGAPNPYAPGVDVNYGAQFVVVGTTIYLLDILANGAVVKLVLHVYNTLTDTWGSDSALSPDDLQGASPNQSMSLMADGHTLLITTIKGTVGADTLVAYTYDTTLSTWGAAHTISATHGLNAVGQVLEPVSGDTYVFYGNSSTKALRAAQVSSALAVRSDTLVVSLTGYPNNPTSATFGNPLVFNGEIIVPLLRFNPSTFAPYVYDVRATVPVGPATPVWTLDTIDTTTSNGSTLSVQNWDQQVGPNPILLVVSGTLYLFYIVDNGDLDSAASTAWVYYRSYIGAGAWSALTVATSAVPGEMFPLGATVLSGNPMIYFNMMAGSSAASSQPPYSALSSYTLYASGASSGGGTRYYSFNTTSGPVELPDASVHCDVNGQKKCLTPQDHPMLRHKTARLIR